MKRKRTMKRENGSPQSGRSLFRLWVEVGENSLACVLTDGKDNRARIVASLVKELAAGRDATAASHQESATRALKDFLAQQGITEAGAICVLPNDLVHFALLELSRSSAENLSETAETELARQMGVSASQVALDYLEVSSAQDVQKSLFAAAAKREDIQAAVNVIEGAGGVVEDVRVGLPECGHALTNGGEGMEGGENIVVDIGDTSIHCAFFKGAVPKRVARHDGIGEAMMLSSLRETVLLGKGRFQLAAQMTMKEAKALMEETGVANTSAGEGKLNAASASKARSVLLRHADAIVEAIRRLTSETSNRSQLTSAGKIFVTGKGAYVKGLPTYIEEKLGVPSALLSTYGNEHTVGGARIGSALSHVLVSASSKDGVLSLADPRRNCETGGRKTRSSFWYARREKHLWVELGRDWLELTCTGRARGSQRVLAHASTRCTNVSKGEPQDRLSFFRDGLEEFVHEHGLKGTKTTLLMPSDLVALAPVKYPQMSKSELGGAVRLSLSAKLGISKEELCADFIESEITSHGAEALSVVAAGMRRADVQLFVGAAEAAGCLVREITHPLAGHGALLPAEKGTSSLVIDIGRDTTSFAFYEGNTLTYCREDTSFSEEQIRTSVCGTISRGQTRVQLTMEEAKAVLKAYGIACQTGDEDVTGKAMPLFTLYSMLRPLVSRLVAIARNMIVRYGREYSTNPLAAVYIAGPGGYVRGLPEFLSGELGLKCSLLSNVRLESATAIETSWDSADLALSHAAVAAATPSISINLLPSAYRYKRLLTSAARVCVPIFVATLVLLAAFGLGLREQALRYETLLAGMHEMSSGSQDEHAEALAAVRKQEAWYGDAIEVLPAPHMWAAILGEFARSTPSEIVLEELLFTRDKDGSFVEFTARIDTTHAAPENPAFEFAKRLEASPVVEEILFINRKQPSHTAAALLEARVKLRRPLRRPDSDMPTRAEQGVVQ
jgi:Tfp pilus assembly PilM family ATPase